MTKENQKYHFIYKITNNINGKIYIGKHSTYNLNDGYMGSGLILNKAIKSDGIENFTKEILEFCDTEEDAYNREKEIVTEEFVKRRDTYNVFTGGKGFSSDEAVKYGAPALIKYNKSEKGRIKSKENLVKFNETERAKEVHKLKGHKIGSLYGSKALIEYNKKNNFKTGKNNLLNFVNSKEGRKIHSELMTKYNKSDKHKESAKRVGHITGKRNLTKLHAEMNALKENDPNDKRYILWKYKRSMSGLRSAHTRLHKNISILDCPYCRDKLISIYKNINSIDNDYLYNSYKNLYNNLDEYYKIVNLINN